MLKTQVQELIETLKPVLESYRNTFPNLTEYEKRVLFAENLCTSELIRLTTYLYIHDYENVDNTLKIVADLIQQIDTKNIFNKNSLVSEIEIYIKNQEGGRESLLIEKIEAPMLMKILNYYDTTNLTNHIYIVSNYLFQILNLILKSDGLVTEVETKLLIEYQKALHNFHEEKNTNSRNDLLSLNSIFNDFFGSVQSTRIENKNPTENKTKTEEAKNIGNIKESPKEEVHNLDDLMKELHELIGLSSVKDEVTNLINVIKVEKLRKEKNLPVPVRSLHMVFTGNPGTGKTTIARLVAKIFKSIGVLEKGHLIETDRSGLVAGYVGQTATKTVEVCNKSLGGILFIDEAYALAEGGENDFGKEAINTLLKFMEDNRGNFLVIVAGYTDNMKSFIDKNPGLQSRFNKYIHFPDYIPEELFKIFSNLISKSKLKLLPEAESKIHSILQKEFDARDKKFGNGRFVRNLFEKIYSKQANRIVQITELTEEILCTIHEEDIID